jgi:hypothetical protein
MRSGVVPIIVRPAELDMNGSEEPAITGGSSAPTTCALVDRHASRASARAIQRSRLGCTSLWEQLDTSGSLFAVAIRCTLAA